ncbi:MAG: hypothetical protein M0P64_03490 [Candidatus Pacebacteria bacterium]|jgi:hypothetical protein|nr:hypothetical protein [Candidatus Paceibacterota bacterium]
MFKTKQKTLILLGIASVFMLGSIGGYAALFFAIKDKTIATTPLVEKIDELSNREARITASIATLRAENEKVEKLFAYFFKENDIVTFAKKIELLGIESGAEVTLDGLEQAIVNKTTPTLSFRISALGGFDNIQRLMLLLENFPGKLEWKSASVTRSNQTLPAEWRFDASLTMRNFLNE